MQSPLFSRFDHFVQARTPWRAYLFVPGAALLLFGFLVLMLPRLFLALFAALFVFVGVFLLALAWKIFTFQRHLGTVLKQRIVIQGVQVPVENEPERRSARDIDIIVH